jgi:hypothetical protein
MKIEKPLDIGFTIYTKSGCSFCINLKKLLIEKCIFFFEIDCDNYLIENKEEFLSFITESSLASTLITLKFSLNIDFILVSIISVIFANLNNFL